MNRIVKMVFRSRYRIKHNVTAVLRDKDGNIKPIFQQNKLFTFLIVHGIVSPHFHKIPFLLGRWSDKMSISNLIPTVGAAGIASRLMGSGAEAVFIYIGVGTGSTAANATDTGLETETTVSGLTRATGAISRSTTDVTNDTAEITKTFSVTGTVAVTESGVLNAAFGSGTLLNRQVFAAINVVNSDALQMTHKFDVD